MHGVSYSDPKITSNEKVFNTKLFFLLIWTTLVFQSFQSKFVRDLGLKYWTDIDGIRSKFRIDVDGVHSKTEPDSPHYPKHDNFLDPPLNLWISFWSYLVHQMEYILIIFDSIIELNLDAQQYVHVITSESIKSTYCITHGTYNHI